MSIKNDCFTEYGELITKRGTLDEEIDTLKAKCLTKLSNIDGKQLKAERGTFSIMNRKEHTFPEEISAMIKPLEKELKETKAEIKKIETDAINMNKVETKETPTLRYQPIK